MMWCGQDRLYKNGKPNLMGARLTYYAITLIHSGDYAQHANKPDWQRR
ncbi:MAG: hypothetical protein ACLU30_18785 [Odoribacter splanchnicus]